MAERKCVSPRWMWPVLIAVVLLLLPSIVAGTWFLSQPTSRWAFTKAGRLAKYETRYASELEEVRKKLGGLRRESNDALAAARAAVPAHAPIRADWDPEGTILGS